MKKLERKRESLLQKAKGRLLTFGMLVSVLGCLGYGTFTLSEMSGKHGMQVTKEAVRRAVIQCYAIEGVYPPNVEHIVKEYGLTYDATKYYIFYEVFASNIMPTVEVYEKR